MLSKALQAVRLVLQSPASPHFGKGVQYMLLAVCIGGCMLCTYHVGGAYPSCTQTLQSHT